MSSLRKKQEPYLGSVRFFRHLILTILALLIIIPICISITLFYKQSRLKAEYEKQGKVIQNQTDQLREAQELSQNASKTAADSSSAGDGSVSEHEPAPQLWNLIVVNSRTCLPEDFSVDLVEVGDGQYVDKRIAAPLNQMMSDAHGAGIDIYIYSSYRSMEKQQGLFNASVAQYLEAGDTYNEAFYKTKKKIALPSESEHQTGLMVDIIRLGQKDVNSANTTKEGATPQMQWLEEHCADYGFIRRYPANKSDITGIDYEPYCFRYVGQEAAKVIMDDKITLEEYLQMKNPK